jgi:8-oxo-dGTP diphosphatase
VASRDGNGWVRCDLGHRHWGRFGAAGLLAYVGDGGPVLLQQRTWWSHHGGTWGLPGGARDSHESVLSAALREAAEECGVPPELVRPRGIFTDDHGGWSYTTVLAHARAPFAVESDYDESEDVEWVPRDAVASLSLHPGLGAHWPQLRAALEPLTIIVDGANVVGSRPDGWWRDRAGAAVRLRNELSALVTAGITRLPDSAGELPAPVTGTGFPTATAPEQPAAWDQPEGRRGRRRVATLQMTWLPDIVLVVEGVARPAAEAADDDTGGVRVVAATGSGDDQIAELAAQIPGRRIVVTADRELRRRAIGVGASVAGPSWLLGAL